ncbi:HEAT repeat domain-containing protein [Grimontia sp. NTOU-MAR1]|uniref:HEAT repeat domain-containing protein n=1 Tax=Grimontia sp. NTOU-MAR1 TaxID=3111011 RepID=UPI002DBC7F24|nr:HEAT repeat domain-containing protein [Grimontia sp. NTOU-MAR1]WRW00276.1 HEAT repeat domain-containing protein [Grimontia sp. NTOU-MAR1]
MNRNIILISLIACSAVAASFVWFDSEPEVQSNNITFSNSTKSDTVIPLTRNMTPNDSEADYIPQGGEEIPSIRAYKAIVNSKLSTSQTVLADFTNALSFQLDIERGAPRRGVVFDVTFESEDPNTQIPPYLGFTFKYHEGAFSDVSMLGLEPMHPLNLMTVLLQQFSYYEGIQSLQLPDGTHTYLYEIQGNAVSRQKTAEIGSSASYETLEDSDLWQLKTDRFFFPERLTLSTRKTIVMDGSEMQLDQQIIIKPITPKGSLFTLANYGAGTNSQYKVALMDTAPELEVADENFMETLVSFDANPTLDTAQVLGVYLVSQGWGFVRDLLTSDDITDSMRSSLIFALERSGEQEGEYLLSSIIEDDSLGETDRLRAIMSISKMGEVNSQVALSTLQDMLTHSNSLLAKTAMLNIGILGKQNPRMTNEVTGFLANKLSSSEAGYSELVAIANLGNAELDNRVLPYLDSEYADERQVAAKMLSRNPEMQSRLLNQMLNDSHPSVVKAIAEGIETNTQNLKLSETYQAQLRNRIGSPDILTPTRDLLFAFLANNAQPTELNKSVARKILETPDVSESTLALAQDLINR